MQNKGPSSPGHDYEFNFEILNFENGFASIGQSALRCLSMLFSALQIRDD